MALDNQVLIYQLISARAAIDAALAVLTGVQPAPEPGCQHPEERRIQMATMGSPNHWKCRDCGHEEGG